MSGEKLREGSDRVSQGMYPTRMESQKSVRVTEYSWKVEKAKLNSDASREKNGNEHKRTKHG